MFLRARSITDFLVHDLWVTIVTLQLGKDVVGIFAAEVAEAGLDPHHLPCESRPVGALEVYVDGLGLVRDAASFVSADATEFGPVLLLADAARKSEVRGQIFPVDVQALLSWLRKERHLIRLSFN